MNRFLLKANPRLTFENEEEDDLTPAIPFTVEQDRENRLNAREVFQDLDKWPEDLEEFDRKLNSAVDGLLDHGPPKNIFNGMGKDGGLMDNFEFEMDVDVNVDTGQSKSRGGGDGHGHGKKREVDDTKDLVNLMKGIDATLKSRRKFLSSPSGQFFALIFLTVLSIIGLSWVQSGVWIELHQCTVGPPGKKFDLCKYPQSQCVGPVLGKFWCHKKFMGYHKQVVEKLKHMKIKDSSL